MTILFWILKVIGILVALFLLLGGGVALWQIKERYDLDKVTGNIPSDKNET
jgi:hypothetical protein